MFILLFLLTCFLCVYEDNQSTIREQKRTCFFVRRKPRNIGAFSFLCGSLQNAYLSCKSGAFVCDSADG